MLVSEIIRQRTHFLERTRAFIIGQIEVGINTPQQTVRLTFVGGIVGEREVPEPRLQTKVLEMLPHIVSGNLTHIEIETDKRLRPPDKFLVLFFHEVATVHESRVERATLLRYVVDEINFAESNPRCHNHSLAEFAIFGERTRLGLARCAEVAEDFIHTFTIAWFRLQRKE